MTTSLKKPEILEKKVPKKKFLKDLIIELEVSTLINCLLCYDITLLKIKKRTNFKNSKSSFLKH